MARANSARHELAIMVVGGSQLPAQALMHQIRGLVIGNLLEAQDGIEALAQCQHHRVDILFCDLRMPGMDGMPLRRLPWRFRGGIVLCSALEDDVVDAAAHEPGHGLRCWGASRNPRLPSRSRSFIGAWRPQQVRSQEEDGYHLTLDELRGRAGSGPVAALVSTKVGFRPGGGRHGGACPLAASRIWPHLAGPFYPAGGAQRVIDLLPR